MNCCRTKSETRSIPVLGQDVDSFEVIVVDNGSRDGSAQMVREEFASIRLVALNENTGIRGRKVGFELATADVVLSLDDDIELLRPDTLRRVAEAFERDPTVGALTLKICEEPDRDEFAEAHWWHPLPRERFQHRSFATDHLSEAAVAFRTPVLRGAGWLLRAAVLGR